MRVLTSFFLSLSLAVTVWAQRADPSFDPVKDVSLRFEKGAVVVGVPAGAHLKASFMDVAKKEGPGTLKMGKLPPTTAKDELGDGIWHGLVNVPVSGEGLSGKVTLQVTYQPCTEGEGGVCYPPTTQQLEVKAAEIPATPRAVPTEKPAVSPIEKEKVVEASKMEATPAAKSVILPVEKAVGPPKVASAAISRMGTTSSEPIWWGLIVAFGWGLVAAFSPCVYPMIPITLAIVGAKGGSRLKGLFLSLVLVLGMAVTYMTLAVLTARVGGVFGAFAQRPGFLVPVAILFAIFALSLFGAFEIRLPSSWQTKLQSGAHSGWAGAFVMGLVLGPISAPCVGPYFGTVLTVISQEGQVGVGALKAFIFALGMGSLFIAVGGFSAVLPKSGDWLDRLKHLMGLVVLGFAVWSVRLLIPEWALLGLWAVVAFIAVPVFGAFEPATSLVPGLRKALGIAALVLGILLGVRSVETGLDVTLLPKGGVAVLKVEHAGWLEQDLEGALARAKAEHKLVLVDIYADWCAQCKELDEKTWPDPGVKQWIAQNAVPIRIDTDARRKDLATKLQIRSYPTVLLLDIEGRELRRILGFQKPETMRAWLEGQ
jgi:thiol:disulfide interchange protein DsbD